MDNKKMNKENDFKNDFFTKEQLQECIDVNIGSIITKLDNYIYYDGILTDSGRNEDLYVTGFIKIKPFFFDTYIDDRGEEHHIHSYVYKCGAYCSRPELSNNEDLTPDRFFNTNYATIYYYYHDFVDYCAQLRLPIKDIAEKDDFWDNTLNGIFDEDIGNENLDGGNGDMDFKAPYQQEPQYPLELQLAIDAYDKFCRDEKTLPKNKVIEDWLIGEAFRRNILQLDGSEYIPGLSQKKAQVIASIVKSK